MKKIYILISILIVIVILESAYIVSSGNVNEKKNNNNNNNNIRQLVYDISGKNENWKLTNGFYYNDSKYKYFEDGIIKYTGNIDNIKTITIKINANSLDKQTLLVNFESTYNNASISPSKNDIILSNGKSSTFSEGSIETLDTNCTFEANIRYTTFDNMIYQDTIPLSGTTKVLEQLKNI